jgi:hypothetical protein
LGPKLMISKPKIIFQAKTNPAISEVYALIQFN